MSLPAFYKNARSILSKRLREAVLRHYLIPDSRHGLPPALVKHWKPKEPLTLIDAGASFGSFTTSVAKHHRIGRALLVEPLTERCAQLRATFSEPVFTVCQQALADFDGQADFNVFDFDYASSLHAFPTDKAALFAGLELGQQRKLPVTVGTLDVLLERENITGSIELLKMDVQGGELNVLKGAQRSLERVWSIWCEVAFEELYENAATFQQIYDFLVHSGFVLQAIGEATHGIHQEVLQVDVLFSRV